MPKSQSHLSLITFLGILVFVALACNMPTDSQEPPPAVEAEINRGSLTLGDPQMVMEQSIGPDGGRITVEGSGTPIDGLTIEIPPGAYASETNFSISYQETLDHSFGPDFNPQTPLIEIDNGGVYADQFLRIKIPMQIAEDAFAMAFIYDAQAGQLEGLPVLAKDGESIIVATRHFSKLIASMIQSGELDGNIFSAYLHKVHNWQFVNNGSFVQPGGICAGMSLSALYAFEATSGSTLYEVYDNYNNQYIPTPGFHVDDTQALRLASIAQALEVVERNPELLDSLSMQHENPYLAYLSFSYAMMVTGEPQLLVANSSSDKIGHAVIVYGKVEDTFYISDPNDPINARTLQYNRGANSFSDYVAGGSAKDSKKYNFSQIYYVPKSSAIDWGRLGALWGQFQAGNLSGEGYFPAYRLIAEIEVEEGKNYTQPLQPGFRTPAEKIKVHFEPVGFSGRVTIYQADAEAFGSIDGTRVETLELQEGDNWFGFEVEAQSGSSYTWVDFQWINIIRGKITDFSGQWTGGSCGEGSEFPYQWSVSLLQDEQGKINGTIRFHDCENGYVVYAVSGQALEDQDYVDLSGVKNSGSGEIFDGAADQVSFTFTPGFAPNPDLSR
jgi:hypothetical protein